MALPPREPNSSERVIRVRTRDERGASYHGPEAIATCFKTFLPGPGIFAVTPADGQRGEAGSSRHTIDLGGGSSCSVTSSMAGTPDRRRI